MARGKKKAEAESSSTKRVTRSETRRVTRSVTRKEGSSSTLSVRAEVPKRKQTPKKKKKAVKTPEKTQAAAANKEKETQSDEALTDAADVGKETEQTEHAAEASGPQKVIIIERCTQCSSFKKAATTVKEGLEAAVPGVRVIVNPEKPRKGCLEVRDDGDQIFLSLLNMKRPFTRMKNLDMEKVISDIVNQIKD